ncbi:MAG: hypothetical protein GY898_00490 [Proteobacteria bacterium]|nr:hypothetical protein [Pseudomonadota bacterium]
MARGDRPRRDRPRRANQPLDLELAPCANDPNIEWSPHDVLVFISLPAW